MKVHSARDMAKVYRIILSSEDHTFSKQNHYLMRYLVLTVTSMKTAVFWVVASRCLYCGGSNIL